MTRRRFPQGKPIFERHDAYEKGLGRGRRRRQREGALTAAGLTPPPLRPTLSHENVRAPGRLGRLRRQLPHACASARSSQVWRAPVAPGPARTRMTASLREALTRGAGRGCAFRTRPGGADAAGSCTRLENHRPRVHHLPYRTSARLSKRSSLRLAAPAVTSQVQR